MRIAVSILLLFVVCAGADGEKSAKLECSLIMPDTVIDGKNLPHNQCVPLALNIKNISPAPLTVCTYRNGVLSLSADGE
ncbi:MAG: hypothetical protein LBK60_12645 [Verrucomicrobiales bacterium]|nr:hypothetical protein [Verrucomicrobiales bacterium]